MNKPNRIMPLLVLFDGPGGAVLAKGNGGNPILPAPEAYDVVRALLATYAAGDVEAA